MSNIEDEINNASIENRLKMAIDNPGLAGLVYKANEVDRKKSVAGKAQQASPPVSPSPPQILQGDTRGLHPKGLHTPTMQEIVNKAHRPDPTLPHFDTNRDVPTLVNPLAPHPDFSGEVPRIVKPSLKPPFNFGGNG